MVTFHSAFDEAPDLSSPEGIRATIRESYDRHTELTKEVGLPPDTTLHEASMYGIFSSFCGLNGTRL